jgi:hypothetical protein
MAEKEELTISEKWIKRLDENAVEQMQNDAVGEVEGDYSWVYIFKDGSSVYEKRRGDWYPGDEYVQCPSCEEWREVDEATGCDCKQAEAAS